MKRILVPIDFSESARNALQYAHQLSANLGMPLSLLNCYPAQVYSRRYHFGKKEYSMGIREMLVDFYKKNVEEQLKKTLFLAKPGSVVDTVASISKDYQLVVLSGNTYGSKLKRWMGSRTSYITAMAQCPVLTVPPSRHFEPWEKVWQIKRKHSEKTIPVKLLTRLKIEPSAVAIKCLEQTAFTSALWEAIVAYEHAPRRALKKEIMQVHEQEGLDLIMLAGSDRSSFQKFITDDAKHLFFQFNLPVLVFPVGMIK